VLSSSGELPVTIPGQCHHTRVVEMNQVTQHPDILRSSRPFQSYSQPRTYKHNKVSKLKSNFQLKHNPKVRQTHQSPEGMMTTLFSSRGATGGRTRWLVLTRCEDAGPEADPSPPTPSSYNPTPSSCPSYPSSCPS
jgi:hypothetical protein